MLELYREGQLCSRHRTVEAAQEVARKANARLKGSWVNLNRSHRKFVKSRYWWYVKDSVGTTVWKSFDAPAHI